MPTITMYLGSMDHSPSEQISTNPDDWHTTVAIFSEGGEHWSLASDIAKRMGLSGGTLKKWSGRLGINYKSSFEQNLLDRAGAHPVHIFAVSAQAGAISAALAHLLRELQLTDLVERLEGGKRPKLRVGPFFRLRRSTDESHEPDDAEPTYFILSERQGTFLMFLCHSLFQMHRTLLNLVKQSRPELQWIDWQLMPNRFPNDIDGPMSSLFGAIMSGAPIARLVSGTMRVAHFVEKDADHGSLLADNIAGLLASKIRVNERELNMAPGSEESSSRWEIWNGRWD